MNVITKGKGDRIIKDKGIILEYWKNGGPGAVYNNEGKSKSVSGRKGVPYSGGRGGEWAGWLGRGGREGHTPREPKDD